MSGDEGEGTLMPRAAPREYQGGGWEGGREGGRVEQAVR